jgi:hypothetical protein
LANTLEELGQKAKDAESLFSVSETPFTAIDLLDDCLCGSSLNENGFGCLSLSEITLAAGFILPN